MNGKKKKRKVNTGKMIILLSFILMLVIGMYAFINSSIFNIKNVDIQGNNRVSSDIIKKELGIKNNKNIFMYSTENAKEKLEKNKYIDSVIIKKVLPNELSVNIKEKEIIAVLKGDNGYSYIDKDGKVIDNVKELNDGEVAIILDVDYSIDDNGNVEFKNEEMKKGILYLLECIKDNNLNKKINKIDYKKNGIINMYTKEGIHIILNNNQEIKYNVSRTREILIDLQSKNAKSGVIDLTTGGYAVYRP